MMQTTSLFIRSLTACAVVSFLITACGVVTPEPGCERDGFSCTLEISADGTVSDPISQLVWQRADSGTKLTWNDAAEYCAQLTLAGHDDWALPGETEYLTLFQRGNAVAIDDYVFTPVREFYWTATTTDTARAKVIDLRSGENGVTGLAAASRDEKGAARCVRYTAGPDTGLKAGVTALAAGTDHTCALLDDGTAQCWGANDAGQLGDGSKQSRTKPAAVKGLRSSAKITSLASGYLHTCAAYADGKAQCWGYNSDGQLGDGTKTDRTTAVDVKGLTGVRMLATGYLHTCALTTAGGVWCWGFGKVGALGDGLAADSTTPVAVSGLSAGVKAIAAGGTHTCALLDAGTVRCWGLNSAGELGDGTAVEGDAPVTVQDLSGAVALAAHGGLRGTLPIGFTCTILAKGTVKCWGANGYGQLGMGTAGSDGDATADQYTPAPVDGLDGAPASLGLGFDHACAVSKSGAVACWGRNDAGQLGDETRIQRSTPVAAEAEGFASVAAGSAHTCGLKKDGSVTCWGDNRYGQLGR